MVEKLNIVQSTTEPDKNNIWLKDGELKKFGAKGWSTVGGGGINAFQITLNIGSESNPNLIVDGESFAMTIDEPDLPTYKIRSRKLFAKLNDIIYNKKYFIIANVDTGVTDYNNNSYLSPCFCNVIRNGTSVIAIYFTFDITIRINISDTD